MSPRLAVGSERSGAGRVAITAALVVAVALGLLLIARARPDAEPFDPRSGSPGGTRALVLLLESQGAQVTIERDLPAPGSVARVLVIDDRLDGSQRDGLRRWAQAGGVVVVADPASPLQADGGASEARGRISGTVAGGQRDVEAEIDLPAGQCDIAALAHLRGLFVADGELFQVDAGQRRCFSMAGTSFVVARAEGQGFVIGLGDNHLLTNRFIRFGDNSGLATALLAPAAGSEVVILLGSGASRTAADVGTGHKRLVDLVRPGVWMALAQLAIAFVVFAVARAVRAGRPVNEPRPAPVAGSELVVATGNLMQRAGHSEHAGWLLRGELYRELCRRCALPPTTPIAVLDRVVAERFGRAPGTVADVLSTDTPDAAALLVLSNRINRLAADVRDHRPEGARP